MENYRGERKIKTSVYMNRDLSLIQKKKVTLAKKRD